MTSGISILRDSIQADTPSHLVCTSRESLMKDARWDGALGHSRQSLLHQLSSMYLEPAATEGLS